MSILNRNQTSQPLDPAALRDKRRRLLIIFGLVVIFISLLASQIRGRVNQSGTLPKGEYYDSASRQTVSNPANRTPETFGETLKEPVYLGFAELYKHGLSEDQISVVKFGFVRYFETQSSQPEEISVFVDTIAQAPYDVTGDQPQQVGFDVLINRKEKLYAQVDFYEAVKINMTINKKKGSGPIYKTGELTTESRNEEEYLGD